LGLRSGPSRAIPARSIIGTSRLHATNIRSSACTRTCSLQPNSARRPSPEGYAVEPDVIVTSLDTASRNVTDTGAVNAASVVPLSLAGEKLTDVITKSGGVRGETYDTFVTVTRGNKSGTVLMSALIDNPTENIWVQSGDEITLVRDPRQFTVLGAVKSNKRQAFGSRDLSLIEALGMSRGGNDLATDAEGFFVFRYEEAEIAASLLGRSCKAVCSFPRLFFRCLSLCQAAGKIAVLLPNRVQFNHLESP
jgi:hypothetical protein